MERAWPPEASVPMFAISNAFTYGTHLLSASHLPSTHRRRKRGICKESDTPAIYVGDIDMYIPLEKSNT